MLSIIEGLSQDRGNFPVTVFNNHSLQNGLACHDHHFFHSFRSSVNDIFDGACYACIFEHGKSSVVYLDLGV